MPNEQQYELIGGGVDPWNAWRAEHRDEAVDLSGADLELANLKGVNLKGANLEGANLLGAELEKADLSDASLYGANLKDANLRGAVLRAARLRRADLESAFLEGADLQGADLSKAVCVSTFLGRANLKGAKLDAADLKGADLEGSDCSGASLVDAKMGDVNLAGARCGGAVCDRANLRSANLEGAVFRGASLKGAKLYNANLDGTDFTAANLEGAQIFGANLVNTRFEGAGLEGAQLDEKSQRYVLGVEEAVEEAAPEPETLVSVILAPRLSFTDIASVVADLEQLVAACVLAGDPGASGDALARFAERKLGADDLAGWLRYQYMGRYHVMFSVARLSSFAVGKSAEIGLSIRQSAAGGKLLRSALAVIGSLRESANLKNSLMEMLDRRRRENEPEGGSIVPPRPDQNPSLIELLQGLCDTQAGTSLPDEPRQAVMQRARDQLKHLPEMNRSAIEMIAPRIAEAYLNPCLTAIREAAAH